MCQYCFKKMHWKLSGPRYLKGLIEFKAKVTFSLLSGLARNETPSKSVQGWVV